MASLAFAAHAVTYMNVKTDDGSIVKYDVEHVTEVYYTEEAGTPGQTVDGVTVSGKEGLYTYVDLGLPSGTKWATYNVGATKPTEYGDYFAWGETKPKEDYSWSTYKWCKGSEDCMTKYCTGNTTYGVDKMVLDAEDDAATANWGSSWRMPTEEEQEELQYGCDWKWVEDFNGSGVNGRLGTSKKNGSTIFLPAAGDRGDADFYCVGILGHCWSSSLCEDNSAFDLYFDDDNYIFLDCFYRNVGLSVRAVLR